MKNNFYKEKKDIVSWLSKMGVSGYQLVESKKHGFIVDVNGDVNLVDKSIDEFKVQFGIVSGGFACGGNPFKNLIGAPNYVGGMFQADSCDLKSLLGGPERVVGDFNVQFNELKSLEYLPQYVGDKVEMHSNPKLGEANFIKSFDDLKKMALSEKLEKTLKKQNSKTVKLKI